MCTVAPQVQDKLSLYFHFKPILKVHQKRDFHLINLMQKELDSSMQTFECVYCHRHAGAQILSTFIRQEIHVNGSATSFLKQTGRLAFEH